MLSEHSAKTTDLLQRMQDFFDANIYPNELRHAQEMDAFRIDWDAATLGRAEQSFLDLFGVCARQHALPRGPRSPRAAAG